MNDDGEQTLFTGTTATLSGGVDQTVHTTTPDNVQFVMGPDGQMVAIQKEPFVWKQFFIGFTVPVLLFVIPLMSMVIVEEIHQSQYVVRDESMVMTQVNNTTAYTGYYEVPSGYNVYDCHVHFNVSGDDYEYGHGYYCNLEQEPPDYEKTIAVEILLEQNEGDEGPGEEYVVGTWTASNGTVHFDDGEDHNSSFEVEFEIENDPNDEIYHTMNDLMPICCFLGPLSGIGLAVYGFSAAKKSLGIGALTALAAGPVLSFFACLGAMVMMGF